MKNFFLMALLVAIVIIYNSAEATRQLREKISIDDEVYFFDGYPLEQLLSIAQFREKHKPEFICLNSWRGYQGNWSISNSQLFLIALKDHCNFDSKGGGSIDLERILPDFDREKYYYKAKWYSGEIVIPIGDSKLIEGKKTKSGYQVYERQVIVYLIQKGDVKYKTIEYRER